jgi:ribonuclease HI
MSIHYKVSNNDTEYEALIHGLRIVISLGIKWLIAYDDSKVVIDQVNKACDIKDTVDIYYTEARKLEAHFEAWNSTMFAATKMWWPTSFPSWGPNVCWSWLACLPKTYESH